MWYPASATQDHSISHRLNRSTPRTPTPAHRGTKHRAPDGEEDIEYFPPTDGGDDGGDDGGGDNDDEDPDYSTHPSDDEQEPGTRALINLTCAISKLAHNNRSTSGGDAKSKVREPDTFDGTDPCKLRAFFVQCELNFQNRPKAFRDDHTKVTFAQSYLKGMALEWFEPDILPSDGPADLPDWVDSYADFMAELQENFGPHDPAGDAEMQLEQLHMRDSQHINKYIVEFQWLATQVCSWGDGALHCQFYNGLPACIKDNILTHAIGSVREKFPVRPLIKHLLHNQHP